MATSAVVLPIGDQHNEDTIEDASYCKWMELDGSLCSGEDHTHRGREYSVTDFHRVCGA